MCNKKGQSHQETAHRIPIPASNLLSCQMISFRYDLLTSFPHFLSADVTEKFFSSLMKV
jgi:hypothetical protein